MRTIALLSLVALPGCTLFDSPFVGMWLVEIGDLSDPEVNTDITENFLDANVPDDPDFVGEWEYIDETETSDQAVFAQIERVKGGEFVMVVDDEVYVGTVEEGVLKAMWTFFSDGYEADKHDSGYVYEEDGRNETTITWQLERDADTGGLKGKYKVDVLSDVTYTETDEWDVQSVGFQNGTIPSRTWLEGDGNRNTFDTDECTGNNCEITVVTDSHREGPLTLRETRFDEEVFDAIENAGQPGG